MGYRGSLENFPETSHYVRPRPLRKLLKLLCFHDVSVLLQWWCFLFYFHSSLKCLQVVEDRREETIWLPSSELRPFQELWVFMVFESYQQAREVNWGVVDFMSISSVEFRSEHGPWAAGCDDLTRYSSLCFGMWFCGEFYKFIVPFLIWIMKWEIEIYISLELEFAVVLSVERSQDFFLKMSWNQRNLTETQHNWSNVFI